MTSTVVLWALAAVLLFWAVGAYNRLMRLRAEAKAAFALLDAELVRQVELVRNQLLYYPTVTREKFRNEGRITELMASGKLYSDLGLPPASLESDRFMICGSPAMLKDLKTMLEAGGFAEGNMQHQGHFVVERAFAER